MKPYLLSFAFLYLSAWCQAQVAIKPALSFPLTGDTVFWEVPNLGAKGRFVFNELEPDTKFRLHFKANQPVIVNLSDRASSIKVTSPAELVKTVTPVEIKHNGVLKVLNVTFIPPFNPSFSVNYSDKKDGRYIFENSPLYELVNIAFAITDKGSKDGSTFNLNTPYYKEIAQYFEPYRYHPLITLLNKNYFQGSPEYRMYRESAYNYSLRGDRIEVTGPYLNFEEGNSILDDKALWEDFALKSNFTAFYNKYRQYYQLLNKNASKMLPVKKMWKWCEQKFPNKYATYRMVISPLVNGFHSTQRISDAEFNECIMFLCSAENLKRHARTKIQTEISYTGLLLTEIDHNYINPVSDGYKDQLNNVFGKVGWITKGSQGEGYGNGIGFFNEYLTHAVYLLYIKDRYSSDEFVYAVKERTDLMTSRGFPRFKEFYAKLEFLYNKKEIKGDLTLAYPELISWASQISQSDDERK